MTPVGLSSRLISECRLPYTCGWQLESSVFNWLIEQVGPGLRTGGWSDGQKWQWNYRFAGRPVDNFIVFEDTDSAVLFKLTWGGQ
jgi:hypothetical protein